MLPFLLFACGSLRDGVDRSAEAGNVGVAGPHDTAAEDSAAPDTGTSPVDTAPEETDTAPADTAGGGSGGGTDTAPTDTAPDPSCGDGTCASDEDCWSCAGDCGACDCPTPTEVVVYTQSAWTIPAEAFLADPSPCADYYIHIPAYSDTKTEPRGDGYPEAVRALGPRLHAVAEFHWSSWAETSDSWYDKGVAFREAMETEGYDVDAGDLWAVNELPSTIRSDDTIRQDARDLFHGLYDGPSGATAVRGIAYTVGMGQGTENFSVYKPYLEDWLSDDDFWTDASSWVRFWAQEVYADPDYVCQTGTTTAERSTQINEYVEHVATLADAGGSSSDVAMSYLDGAYVPLMNAVWMASSGYGNTDVSLEMMEHHVSGQVYAARAWSGTHDVPDGRLGFAWAREDGVVDADLDTLAARMASAIHYAYDEGGGSAAGACSPSGAYTWCQCDVADAEFNDGWETFASW